MTSTEFDAKICLEKILELKKTIKDGIRIKGTIFVKFGEKQCDCVCTRIAITMGKNIEMCVVDSSLGQDEKYLFNVDHTFKPIDQTTNYSTELGLPVKHVERDENIMFDCVYIRLFCTVCTPNWTPGCKDTKNFHVLHLGTKCISLDQLLLQKEEKVQHNYTKGAFSTLNFKFEDAENESLKSVVALKKHMNQALQHFNAGESRNMEWVPGFHHSDFLDKFKSDKDCVQLWRELTTNTFRLSHHKYIPAVSDATHIQCAILIQDFENSLGIDDKPIHNSYRNMLTFLQPQDFAFCFTDITNVISQRFAVLPQKLVLSYCYGGLWRFHDDNFLKRISEAQRDTLKKSDFDKIVLSLQGVLNIPMSDKNEAGYFSDYVPVSGETGNKGNNGEWMRIVRGDTATEKFVQVELTDDQKHLCKGSRKTCYQIIGDDCETLAQYILILFLNLMLEKRKFIEEEWFDDDTGVLSDKIIQCLNQCIANENNGHAKKLVEDIIGKNNQEVLDLFGNQKNNANQYIVIFKLLVAIANILRLLDTHVKLCYGTSGNPSRGDSEQDKGVGEGGHSYAMHYAKCGYHERIDVLEGTAWINCSYDSSDEKGKEHMQNAKNIASVVNSLKIKCSGCRTAGPEITSDIDKNFYRYSFACGDSIFISQTQNETGEKGSCSSKLGVTMKDFLKQTNLKCVKNTYKSLAQGTSDDCVQCLMMYIRNRLLIEEDMPLWTKDDWKLHFDSTWRCEKVEGINFKKNVGNDAFFIETIHPDINSVVDKLKNFNPQDNVYIFDAFQFQDKVTVVWVSDR